MIKYRLLGIEDLATSLFEPFIRYQEVNGCYRKEENAWIIKDICFIEDWNNQDKEYLIECLQNTIKTNGFIYGAFNYDDLVGFVSVEGEYFGSTNQYLQLSSLHVSLPYRRLGIGKELFLLAETCARKTSASKLYLSTHSAKESQAFYRNLGCVDAQEVNQKLFDLEPVDCHLEYQLLHK